MSILTTVTMTAVRYIVCGACKATGVLTEEVAERAIRVIADHYTDHSQKLPKTIATANDRAWKTLEIALAGDSFFNRLMKSAEDRSLASDIRRFLDGLSPAQLPSDRDEFQGRCLKELRDARKRGLLTEGSVDPRAVQGRAGEFARFAEPAGLKQAHHEAAAAMSGVLESAGFDSLGRFLRLTTPCGPVLLVAFEYHFGTAVSKDTELSNRLLHAKLDRLAEPFDAGMARIAGLLDSRFEEI